MTNQSTGNGVADHSVPPYVAKRTGPSEQYLNAHQKDAAHNHAKKDSWKETQHGPPRKES